MRHNWVINPLVISIITMLTLGSLTPAINATLITQHTEGHSTITVDFCGAELLPLSSAQQAHLAEGYSVQLNAKEARQLENIFDTLKTDLTHAATREEASDIINETLTSVDTLGLFPNSIQIADLQRLVKGTQVKNTLTTLAKYMICFLDEHNALPNSRNAKQRQTMIETEISNLFQEAGLQRTSLLDTNSNLCCLIAGKTSITGFQSPTASVSAAFLHFLEDCWLLCRDWGWYVLAELLFACGGVWYAFPMFYLHVWSMLNSFSFGYTIGLGKILTYDRPFEYPAEGWSTTFGVNGVKNWEGHMWGDLPLHSILGLGSIYKPGVFGFTGIHFSVDEWNYSYYLGSALSAAVYLYPK